MENKVRVLSPDVLMEPLLSLVREGNEVPLIISGNSMAPFLIHGRDTVFLSKLTEKPRKGDMILYRRDSGDYILHRVCKVENNFCSFVGDAQNYIETGIRPDQLLAVVKTVRRKGKLITSGDFWWEFFEKVWINMIPLRRMTVGVYTKLKH